MSQQVSVLADPGTGPIIDMSDGRSGKIPVRMIGLDPLVLMLRKIERGLFDLVLPNRTVLRFGRSDSQLHGVLIMHKRRIVRRILMYGELGFAEGYMDGDIDSPDLSAALSVLAHNFDLLRDGSLSAASGFFPLLRKLENMLRLVLQGNSRRGARRNILAHYDLGNEFYRLWLDRTMTYSSAYFTDDEQSLVDAQLAKYRKAIDTLAVQPGQRVLEIGCGWGGFAQYAAEQTQANVTSLTISDQQYAYAQQRIAKAGLDDRVDIRLQDYRDVDDHFDHIVSIEMFEAVGERYWPVFFRMLANTMKQGGRTILQTITVAEDLFDDHRMNVGFIKKYIFPGGVCASPSMLEKQIGAAGLRIASCDVFGQSYARTLRKWTESFDAAADRIAALGFDERFMRCWKFYLCRCEAAFLSGGIDVGQYVLVRDEARA